MKWNLALLSFVVFSFLLVLPTIVNPPDSQNAFAENNIELSYNFQPNLFAKYGYSYLVMQQQFPMFDPFSKLISELVLPPAYADTFGFTLGTKKSVRSDFITGTACNTNATITGSGRIELDATPVTGGCQRLSTEFPISSIPVGSTITDVDLRFDIDLATGATRDCDFTAMEKQPSVSTNQVIYDDIGNGTVFVALSALCFPVGSDKTLDLGASADADLQANLGSGWWAVGTKFSSETRDFGNYFSIFGDTELLVTYTPPPLPSTIDDLQVFPVENSIFMNWTEPAGSPDFYLIERSDGDKARLGSDDFHIYHQDRSNLGGTISLGVSSEFAGAQEITTTERMNVTRLDVSIFRDFGACSGSGVLRGGIWTSSGATLVASSNSTIVGCSIESTGSYTSSNSVKSFFFEPPVQLSSGTTYQLGFNMTGTIDVNTRFLRTASSEVDGTAVHALSDTFPYTFSSAGGDWGMNIRIENFTLIANVSSAQTNFTDSSGLEDGITYFYRVRGQNEVGVAVNGSNIAFTKEPILDDNNSTVINSTSARWYYRESDSYSGFSSNAFDPLMDFTTTGSGHVLINSGGTSSDPTALGVGYILKSFNKTEIFGSNITVGWTGTTITGGTLSSSFAVLDGGYNAENNPDFPLQVGIIVIGGGNLGSTNIVGDFNTITTLSNSSISWGSSTQDFVTVAIWQDDSGTSLVGILDIANVTITNIGMWEFDSGNTVTNLRGNTETFIEDLWDTGYYDQGTFTVAPSSVDLTGLKAYYKFDEPNGDLINLADVVGSTVSLGTPANGQLEAGVAQGDNGIIGNSYLFPGASNGQIRLGTSTSQFNFMHDSPTMTWSVNYWQNTTNTAASQAIIQNDVGTTANVGMDIAHDGRVLAKTSFAAIGRGVLFTSVVLGSSTSGTVPADVQWHMVTVTYDHSLLTNNLKFYVDGVFNGAINNDVGAPSTNNAAVAMQLAGYGDALPYSGNLDEMSIWNRVMTPSEVSQLYNAGNGFSLGASQTTLKITKIATGGDALFNFTIAGPTSFGTSINTTSGNGTTGPSTVTPGTYSVQESIPTGWALTTASCNDGFSTFNVDIVTGIIINAGNNIECTFENVVRCNGLPATIVGTTGNDFIEGTPGNDVIVGLDGDDVILGDSGQDTICGGSGQDYITGEGDDDTIFGEAGADLLNGRGGNDTIDGGPGDDVIVGRDGNDILRGGGGDDHISGENDNDTIEGNGGIDHLSGGSGNDIIDGNADDDILTGGSGNDNLNGRAGFDACIDTIGTNTITNCEITS